MKDFSYLTQSHPAYIEELYRSFLDNPDSVDLEFRKFFAGFDYAISSVDRLVSADCAEVKDINLTKEFAVYSLIQNYIKKGHLYADINPIFERKKLKGALDLSLFGLSEADLDKHFHSASCLPIGSTASLREIINYLKHIYCGSIGFEISSINDDEKRAWLIEQFTLLRSKKPDVEVRKHYLTTLSYAVLFEKFLHTKYVGQKRFSLEGNESLIPALEKIISACPEYEIDEVVIGMAHRGRLNVLTNILRKTYEEVFADFEANTTTVGIMGSGDVKYHLGYVAKRNINNYEVLVHLCTNPSHLEAVDPVALGYARSRADQLSKDGYSAVLPVLIHGDAAIAGQGVLYEILQMSALKGYYTGGTIHIVTNNQIGFTTSSSDTRSSDYCTSIASTINAPVLHVNGDDLEAVVACVELALAYRSKFRADIFVDIVGYRRHGHNEGDDPKFTQPELYTVIEKHPNPRDIYVDFLTKEVNGSEDFRLFSAELDSKIWQDWQIRLEKLKSNDNHYSYQEVLPQWKAIAQAQDEDFLTNPNTAISREQLELLFSKLMHIPDGFKPLRKIERLFSDKLQVWERDAKIDWGTGELLAYASLLAEGNNIRLSGEDIKRGTFSHRHACIFDETSGKEYNRLSNIHPDQGRAFLYNSLLSEYAVLGYEYGYAIANPHSLTIWEAQFGDFANGAQIIIDQFLSSGEVKWNQSCGLVLLLPHGYEGQGPEHSSARIERFLQLAAENNMVITNITTAANLFHALRRQLYWPFRKPLVNFSPKANLRNPDSTSTVEDFTHGHFQEIIDCPYTHGRDPKSINRVLVCSGKIYFDLARKQQTDNRLDVAILRLEQLYPLPYSQLMKLREKYSNATWLWVQEEPYNMGALGYLQMNFPQFGFGFISRNPGAATATGYYKTHIKEQNNIVDTAFHHDIIIE